MCYSVLAKVLAYNSYFGEILIFWAKYAFQTKIVNLLFFNKKKERSSILLDFMNFFGLFNYV